MRLLLVLFFPLLGIFDFARGDGSANIGFIILIVPIFFILITELIIKPITNNGLLSLGLPRQMVNSESRYFKVLTLFIIVMIIGIFRSVYIGTRDLISGFGEVTIIFSIFIFLFLVIIDGIRKNYFDSIIFYVGNSLFGLLLLNILGVVLKIENSGLSANYDKEISNVFVFMGNRLQFPFSTSGQLLAIQAGAVMIFGVFRGVNAKDLFHRLLGLLMILSASFVLVGQGGRASILLTFASVIFLLFGRLSRPFLFPILTLFLLFPLLVLINFGAIVENVFGMIGIDFTRHSGDVASFSNRDIIYASTLASFITQGDNISILFGYGSFGQVTSGISEIYSFLFNNSYSNPDDMPVHNTILQILVDFGVLGVCLFVFIVLRLTQLSKSTADYRRKLGVINYNKNIYLTLLFFILGSSMTEVSITYYSFGLFSLFLVVSMLIVFDRINLKFRSLN